VIPWTEIQPGQGITVSPFVRVFEVMHIPAAAHIINFVVLTAALSSMNCNLYLATRMVFSLSRGDYAPEVLGRVSKKGTPVAALLFSGGGLAAATLLAIWFPGSAYVYMFGVSLFGGLFVWLIVFVTHLSFRKRWREQHGRRLPVEMPLFPYTTIAGGLAVMAILISTWWVEGMRVTLEAGIPWLLLITVLYFVIGRQRERAAALRLAEMAGAPEAAE
jgi:L-asparagine transporter-like permease